MSESEFDAGCECPQCVRLREQLHKNALARGNQMPSLNTGALKGIRMLLKLEKSGDTLFFHDSEGKTVPVVGGPVIKNTSNLLYVDLLKGDHKSQLIRLDNLQLCEVNLNQLMLPCVDNGILKPTQAGPYIADGYIRVDLLDNQRVAIPNIMGKDSHVTEFALADLWQDLPKNQYYLKIKRICTPLGYIQYKDKYYTVRSDLIRAIIDEESCHQFLNDPQRNIEEKERLMKDERAKEFERMGQKLYALKQEQERLKVEEVKQIIQDTVGADIRELKFILDTALKSFPYPVNNPYDYVPFKEPIFDGGMPVVEKLMADAPISSGEKAAELNENAKFATGAQRSKDADDVAFDLFPPMVMRRVAKVWLHGANTYGRYNFERGMPGPSCANHLQDHYNKYMDGDDTDDHQAHMICNLMMWMVSMTNHPDMPENKIMRRKDGKLTEAQIKYHEDFKAGLVDVNNNPIKREPTAEEKAQHERNLLRIAKEQGL